MINLHIANPHGFCFGINRAIDLSKETAKKYPDKNIYFLGELVHNQHVVQWLESELKIKTVQNINDIPNSSVMIIRAHGATPEVFKQAQEKDLIIVDASCPLVLKSHQSAIKLTNENKKVVFICNKIDHDETVGIVGENPDLITPVTIADAKNFQIDDSKNTIVMTQTTLSTLETKEVLDFLKNKYPDLEILPHICQATTDRQNAVIELSKTCSLIIIVGAPNSANSNSLQKVAESCGAKSFIIDNVSELNKDWFIGHQEVGISSGASTPESVLESIINQIKSYE